MVSSTTNKVNHPACESDEWCPQCSFAVHCHEQRMGQANRVAWPAVVLALFIGLGVVVHFFG
ncbi:MAG: hypothetical protein OEQ18_17720 [Gammaproteobacteria bacterium]|nr:hypothetical protein [Gammaproteobacteria bacterium]